ncbi:MAG TPA: ParB N-terminal domain-containing protein [Burkholderiaceae bacterium]|nr:ParB N-terminal domain-containing protein [Burkholderiaceae bacterium]
MLVRQIRCSDIRAERTQDREHSAALDDLVDSIRRYGVLRPVLLRPTPDGYVIVHGERRWLAARKLRLEVIPAYLVENEHEEFVAH